MIYVECKPDLSLVMSLTSLTRREITHEFKGKGEICNRLKKQNSCKGLVDEDPLSSQPRYIRVATIEKDLSLYGLMVRRGSSNNKLIILCPNLEEWILKCADEAGKDVGKYNLPSDARRLHQQINISLDKLEKLLEDLKASSSRLKALKRLLEERQ